MFVAGSLRLAEGSECVDSGNAAALPPDTADLDGDGDVAETLPYDRDDTARIKGAGLDMGAFEQ